MTGYKQNKREKEGGGRRRRDDGRRSFVAQPTPTIPVWWRRAREIDINGMKMKEKKRYRTRRKREKTMEERRYLKIIKIRG